VRLWVVSSVLVVLAIASRQPASPEATFGGGFIPPNRDVARCENTVVRLLRRNAECLDRCTFEAATAALFRGRPFDDERCEARCGASLVRAADALYGRGICPPCITAIAPAPVATLNEQASNLGAGLVACAGTIPLGGDDAGFLPPDEATGRCELAVGRAISRFDQDLLACLLRAARRAFHDKPFDETRCGVTAQRRYDDATAGVTDCPSCLDTNTPLLLGQIRTNVETARRLVYCASPSGALLDEPGYEPTHGALRESSIVR
jgi:hypothetical protein